MISFVGGGESLNLIILAVDDRLYKLQLKLNLMANSRFEYVKAFEKDDRLLLDCYIVIRIDGCNFHSLSKKHDFEKPNDIRALNLMNASAKRVMDNFPDILIGYGQSDEFSFVFKRDTKCCNRREAKLVSKITSLFTASFQFFWSHSIPDTKLLYPPTFDGRAVLYPTYQLIRDYLSWRQADCHINNLYNTTFWALVLKGNQTPQEAERALQGSVSEGKRNEILFSKFGINYNNEAAMFRKGSILIRTGDKKSRTQDSITIYHKDLIKDEFWDGIMKYSIHEFQENRP